MKDSAAEQITSPVAPEWQIRPWQQAAFDQFVLRYRQDRFPHALLLCGAQFIAKTAFSQQLAEFLLCQDPRQNAPCGQCKPCSLCRAGTHPDWLHIAPEESGKSLSVATIRELQRRLGKTAQQCGNKLCTLSPAEAMTENAANALLKILEEPPQNTYFILVTHQLQRIAPTIVSRCQKTAFAIPQRAQVIAWLAERFSSQRVEAAVDLARGFPQRALQLLDEGVEIKDYHREFSQFFSAECGALETVESLDSQAHGQFVDALLHWLAAAIKGLQQGTLRGSGHCLERLPLSAAHRLYQMASESKSALLANANSRLLLESLLLQCGDCYRTAIDESR